LKPESERLMAFNEVTCPVLGEVKKDMRFEEEEDWAETEDEEFDDEGWE
jgi:hypothetical protein